MGAEDGLEKGAEKEEEVVVAVDAVAAVEKKVISSCTSSAVHSSLRIPTATLLLFFISAVFSFVSLASFSSSYSPPLRSAATGGYRPSPLRKRPVRG